jgi:hypothetical protein
MAEVQPTVNISGGEQMKQEYIRELQNQTTLFAQTYEEYLTLLGVYFDRGYGPGGTDPITDDDMGAFGFTVENVSQVVNMVTQLKAFMEGQATAPSVWRSPVNQVRSDV